MLLWVLVYQTLLKMWPCVLVTFLKLQASPYPLSEVSEKFALLTPQNLSYWSQDGMNWKVAWWNESGNQSLKWLLLSITSSAGLSQSISTTTPLGYSQWHYFVTPVTQPFPASALPITPYSSQNDVGTRDIFEFWTIFHIPSWWKY